MENNTRSVSGALHSSVQSMNEKVAHRCAPVATLPECLELHTRNRLAELAKVLSVQKCSKMKKDELIRQLSDKLTDISMLASILTEADEKEFDLFTKAAEKGSVKFGSGELMPFHALHFLGVAAAFQTPGVIPVIVPDEVKQTWRELEKTGFTEEKLRGEMIHKYATAAVNLYGALKLEALIVLIRRFENIELDEQAVKTSVLAHISRNQPYYLWNNYVVNAVFGEDVESLEVLLDKAEDIPRYVPDGTLFAKYASPVFCEDIQPNNAVAEFLTGVVGDSHLAEILLGDLRIMYASGLPENEGYRMLVNSGINFRDMETAQTAAELLKAMYRESRLWAKRGHTLEEAGKLDVIGRNERCMCESGLKYKKCCSGK